MPSACLVAHNGRVNVITVEVRSRGRDGKLYRERPLGQDALTRLRLLTHDLRCRQGLSVRQVQAELAEQHA